MIRIKEETFTKQSENKRVETPWGGLMVQMMVYIEMSREKQLELLYFWWNKKLRAGEELL